MLEGHASETQLGGTTLRVSGFNRQRKSGLDVATGTAANGFAPPEIARGGDHGGVVGA